VVGADQQEDEATKMKDFLFMDNISSHGGSDALGSSNVTVKFLPANTTSHL